MEIHQHETWWDDIKGLSVVDGEFVVTTADASQHPRLEPVTTVLRRIRDALGMDVVYVSQFANDQQIIRYADAEPGDDAVQVGATEDLETSYCYQVVEGRLPATIPDVQDLPAARALEITQRCRIGAYVSAPIRTENGDVFGTLCCFSHSAKQDLGGKEQRALESVAKLLGSALSRARD